LNETRRRAAFDELAAKLKASAGEVEKWKAIPESADSSKRLVEEAGVYMRQGTGKESDEAEEEVRDLNMSGVSVPSLSLTENPVDLLAIALHANLLQ
jgi:hypothetical protein